MLIISEEGDKVLEDALPLSCDYQSATSTPYAPAYMYFFLKSHIEDLATLITNS
jgi:hypothetical protein